MIQELHRMLRAVRSRMQIVRQRWALALCWLLWAAVAGLLWANVWYLDFTSQQLALAIAGAAMLTAVVCRILVLRSIRDPHWIARHIEAKHPELGAGLLAALEQAPSPQLRKLGYLQSSVVREAVRHGRKHNWNRAVSTAQLAFSQIAQLVAFAALVAACTMLFHRGEAVARSSSPPTDLPTPTKRLDFDVLVQPGETEIERGTTLLVVAEFGRDVPSEATLLVEPAAATEGESIGTRPMTRSFEDPKFVGRVASVDSDLIYSVKYAGRQTDRYPVTVFDYPKLERADAQLTYPEYTSLEPKHIDDVRHVTAVEGTELTFRCRLNKEVARALFVDRNGEELPLVRTEDEAPVYAVTLTLDKSRRFKLLLADEKDRQNKLPPEFVVKVTPNRPAELKIALPAKDVRVSPIEELTISGEASDDFGLLRAGISYAIGSNPPQEVVLQDSTAAEAVTKQAEVAHLVAFEALDAEPDQLLSYYLWAEDIGPDGQVRQTMSDMYFAEVRHFEEIFRQGDQPTQQQQREAQQQNQQQGQGTSQQSEELAELQKQIINATWALIRRETATEPSASFADDVGVLVESQQQALGQLDELTEQLTDQESLAHAAAANEQMQEALKRLAEADGTDGLRTALSAEQGAYQALLKLRAREFNVVQGNPQQQQGAQSSSASGQNSRAQQQLNQLELSAEENRYETQSRAQDQREQAQGGSEQAQQVLDRLRELARRQEDLNQRVRQLQSELQAAQSEEEREEIERELKRLREQQQEILRDTDQLQSDMSNSEASSETEEAQQQLEQTRERIQQASEALEQGRMSDAVTEGTRAERDLNELRDEFRRRTADDFSEEMRQLSDSARQLDERQRELTENLSQQQEQQNRSLRDGGARQEVMDGLAQQRREYEDLIERIQETVREAEEPEPLLARELYEAVQQANDVPVPEALDVAEQLLEVGVVSDATETMRAAGNSIRQLREGVDSAAESVLGDDTEALRRAERELEDLSEQLNREIREARGEDAPSDQQRSAQPGETQGEPPAQDGQQQGRQPAEGQQSQGQQTSEQQGQNRGGQPGDQQPRDDQQPNEDQQQSGGQQQGGSQQQAGDRQPQGEPSAGQQPQQGGEQSTQPTPGDQPSDQQQPQGPGGQPSGQQPPNNQDNQRGGGGGLLSDLTDWLDASREDAGGPITGDNFREWSDRMRNVEDLLEDRDLRAEVARIRDRAEAARADYTRNSKEPDWDRLIDAVAEPLAEIRQRVREERRRQESPDSLVPIDRDPVPVEYADTVEKYYQRLGSGE